MLLTENNIKLLDILVKGAFGTLIAALVGYYGYTLENQREEVQEENRRLQATIELTSKQKELDVDLGMRLFGTLMGYYFQRDKSTARPESVRRRCCCCA